MGSKDIGKYMQIGPAIRSVRRSLGLTQREAARRIGIPVSSFSNYENGNRTPGMDTIEVIAKTFGVPKDSLFRRPVDTDFDARHEDAHFVFFDKYRQMIYDNPDFFANEQVTDLLLTTLKLNEAGIQKLIERAEELIEVPRYKKAPLQGGEASKEGEGS